MISARIATRMLVAATIATNPVAGAQGYPDKPIRIVTTAAGNAVDFAARLVAQRIAVPLAQPVIVDNRAGYLSAEILSKALPDGYTLLVAGTPIFYGPLLQKLTYDPLQFAPVSLMAGAPQVLVVSPTLSVSSVAELIALAKSRPGTLNYASAQSGGSGHLAAELFKYLAGVNVVRVAYKSTVTALPDLISGEVHMMFENPTVIVPLMKQGKLKGLAVTSQKPSPLLPGLAAVAASVPGYEILSAATLWAPAQTPAPVINRLNQETVRVLRQPDVAEKFAATGVEVIASSPDALMQWTKAAMNNMNKVIKDANIRVD